MNFQAMLKAEDHTTSVTSEHKFASVGECNGTSSNLCSLLLLVMYQLRSRGTSVSSTASMVKH